ncbi:hypothetical protein UFOVP130_42 [uncultured Caudovirales phage]|uniref:Uncharacterized protein n=1 Tax=uncultured Caudovirales phage TaxID=2100421 RepID=A0A6J5L889_9CAUD|nr:hypothetical protein UFOVP130_42 [uncultured Caudovirales phage]
MSEFRFVGSYCEIDGGRIKLEQFGQRVELPDNVAEIVVRGNGAIIPEDQFTAIGFTDQELVDYAFPGQRAGAPEEFRERVKAAHIAFHDYRQSLEQQEVSN